ncbi:MAG TPA: arginine repressor [Gammaproteobacteria bacterium]|nr:arginine repressor [Gammaproteobacteria bacterium]
MNTNHPGPELDEVLLRLVETGEVRDQTGLLQGLRRKGFEISQPTLSRHLRRLNIIKRRGRYIVGPDNPFRSPPCAILPSPPNLMVLKTLPARAQLLAAMIDQAQLEELAGTMAGDDTVLVAVKDGFTLETAQAALEALIQPAAG